MRPERNGRPDQSAADGQGGQMVTIEAEELRRVTVFFLREAAERIAALGSEAEAPALRARLLALSKQLEEQARLLEQGGL